MAQPTADKLPQLRTTEKEGIRRTTWTELLNDLVFTVIVAQLAQRLVKLPNLPAFFGFLLLYVPIWWLWNGETHYSTRFDNERDVIHRLLSSLQLLGLLVLAAAIPSSLEASQASTAYALTYSAVRVVLLVEYGRAWFYVPDARPYIQHIATGFFVSVVIWSASVLVPVPYRYMCWGVALIIELSTPLTSSGGRLHKEFPPDVRHLPERYGLFTLLVLGQAVASIAQGLIQRGFEVNTVAAALLGGVVIVGLWWAYFDRLDDDAVRQVSEGGSARQYTFWLYLHLPLTIALTVVGVGLTLAIRDVDRPELSSSAQWLFLGSVAGYFLTEGGISLTSLLAGPWHHSFVWGVAVRIGLGISLILIRLTTSLNSLTLLSITAVLVILLIISDYFGPDAPESTERVSSMSS
jgi:low temperature requirement protein LtrA